VNPTRKMKFNIIEKFRKYKYETIIYLLGVALILNACWYLILDKIFNGIFFALLFALLFSVLTFFITLLLGTIVATEKGYEHLFIVCILILVYIFLVRLL